MTEGPLGLPRPLLEDEYKHLFVFHLRGDVSDYGNPEKAQLASMVKGQMRERDIITTPYKGWLPNVSPYTDTTYRIWGRVRGEEYVDKEGLIRDINDKAGGIGAREFMVDSLEIKEDE